MISFAYQRHAFPVNEHQEQLQTISTPHSEEAEEKCTSDMLAWQKHSTLRLLSKCLKERPSMGNGIRTMLKLCEKIRFLPVMTRLYQGFNKLKLDHFLHMTSQPERKRKHGQLFVIEQVLKSSQTQILLPQCPRISTLPVFSRALEILVSTFLPGDALVFLFDIEKVFYQAQECKDW